MDQFDYIIVGAGSAGCVLADRLTASGRHRVLLLERGPDHKNPWVDIPAGYGKLFYHKRLNYGLEAAAEPALNGRADYWPRGRGTGGSGAINAMVYCRGLQNDFDDWEQAGATGWGWDAVRATYDRIETKTGADGSVTGDGSLHVMDAHNQVHPLNRHYFAGLKEQGLPRCDDMNAPGAEGGAAYPLNIRNGRRWHSARAHLAPARRRKNLRFEANCTVRRVILDGQRATGVEVDLPSGRHQFNAKTVILSAGAVHSPQILQLSGIGPGDHLRSLGITVQVENANVGGHLQDHLGINYYLKSIERTLNSELAPWYGKLWAGLRYVLARRGPLALSVNQCGGFFRSHAGAAHPDQQLYFNPVTYTTSKVGKRSVINPDPFPGFILGMQPCRPTSRGRIDITSADPLAAPQIKANPLATEDDQQAVINGGKLCAHILRSPAIDAVIKAPMYCDVREMSDDDILADFRDRCGSVFHPVATCRMGQDASQSVVDPSLRLHGVTGLRVIDASAFPNVTSGNTNAPTMMLAHRAADLILEEENR